MADIIGTAQGVGDNLRGTAGDDKIQGLSGDDVIIAARGDDTVIGGQGSDVMAGGLGADTFEWSAGHIGQDDIDVITDFDIRQGDSLSFLNSAGGQGIEVLSIYKDKTVITEQNGVDLRNNVDYGTDLVIEIMNTATGKTQTIILLDAWSGNLDAMWSEYLEGTGLTIEDYPTEVVETVVDDYVNLG